MSEIAIQDPSEASMTDDISFESEDSATELLLTVTDEHKGIRIDKYLTTVLSEYSRAYLQKLIADKAVFVALKPIKANYKVNVGDQIRVLIPAPKALDIVAEDIPLDILYEDMDILIVNKPKGMVVHPAPGHVSGTLVNAVMYHCKDQLSSINGVMRPGIVHRIDKDTTGILVICKNDAAHQKIAEQLSVHDIDRVYRAIVHHNIREDEGTVDAPIGRHPVDRKKMAINHKNGRRAVTHFKVLERFGNYTYIECRLETGRTHQIRVHMASIGHPLLGDSVYGPEKERFKLEGQTLHAMVLGFRHPRTGEQVRFEAPLPDYFEKILKQLRN